MDPHAAFEEGLAAMSATGYPNPCPTCGENPFQQCRSLTKGRPTDTHAARIAGDWPTWCEQHDEWMPRCIAFGRTHVIPLGKGSS